MDGHDGKRLGDASASVEPSWADFTPAERARIEEGSAAVAAGFYYDEEEVDAWLALLEVDPDAPLPPLQQRPPP